MWVYGENSAVLRARGVSAAEFTLESFHPDRLLDYCGGVVLHRERTRQGVCFRVGQVGHGGQPGKKQSFKNHFCVHAFKRIEVFSFSPEFSTETLIGFGFLVLEISF